MPEEKPHKAPKKTAGERAEGRSGKNTSAGIQVIAVQSISCMVVILLVLLFKLVGREAFSQLRRQFNDSIMSNSVLATLAAMLESPDEEPASSVPPDEGELSAPDDVSSDSSLPEDSSTPFSDSTEVSASTQKIHLAPEGASFVAIHSSRLGEAPLDNGIVTSGYGYRENPTGEGTGFHKGIDIGAPEGTPIHAMFFGVVTETGTSSSYGKYIKIFHGSGLEILYAHCSEILVDKGTVIRAGEVVARVGATGDVTGSHLHLEASVDGIAYNPAGIVPVDRYV